MRLKWIWVLAIVVGLAAYGLRPRPDPASPALWRVDGPQGQRAWLFGTIHALPRAAAWRTDKVAAGLADADRIVVEVAGLQDSQAMARAFAAVAHTPGLPPLDQRLLPEQRPALLAALARIGKAPSDFTDTESWAAALMLARDEAGAGDPAHGVDRALIAHPEGKPVSELEGAAAQFAIFDRLPEPAQRRLLTEAVANDNSDPAALAQAWRSGNVAAIAAQTHQGILADPTLREALYAGRNRAWAQSIAAMMAQRARPFVAVGAAHMAGEDGLPSLLAARGYRVTRVE